MTSRRPLPAFALVAVGLAAYASPARCGSPSDEALDVPASPSDADTTSAPPSAPESRGPNFDLVAAMASVTDRSRGTDDPNLPAEPVAPASDAKAWQFSFTPYLWLFDIDGDVKTKAGRTLPISMHLHDSYDLAKDYIEPSFAGHIEGTDGTFTFFLDGNFLHFNGNGSTSITGPHGLVSVDASLDANLKIQQYEIGGAYRIAEFGANAKRCGSVEILAGARWNSLTLDTDLEIDGARVSVDNEAHFRTSWVDPFVGARTRIPVCEAVDFSLRGDIGGGVGEGCQNVWNVVTGIDWKVGASTSVFLGYRWFDMDRSSGGHDTSLQFEGPAAGVTFLF
jgi:hypothetical protein